MTTEALEKTLPKMAKDIGTMKLGIMKLVAVQTGTPRTKAEQFFASQANKESVYESKFGKMPTQERSVEKKTKAKGGGLGFGPGTSVLDFLKNIANVVIKGALLSAGTFGLSKILESAENRDTIKNFVKDLFTALFNMIRKGSELLTEVLKENDFKEGIISTFVAIKNLLVTAIGKTGDLLSDKRIWEGLWEVIQAVFDAIKKVLSTEIDVGGTKVTLGVVVGGLIGAFYGLKGVTALLTRAALGAAEALGKVAVTGSAGDIPSGGRRPRRMPKGAPRVRLPGAGAAFFWSAFLGEAVMGLMNYNVEEAGNKAYEAAIEKGLSEEEAMKIGQAAAEKEAAKHTEMMSGAMNDELGANIMSASEAAAPSKETAEQRLQKQQERMQAAGLTYGTLVANKNVSKDELEKARQNYAQESQKYGQMKSAMTSSKAPTKENIGGGKEAVEKYLGRPIDASEWDMLLRATYAEGSGRSQEEYAHIMAVILNRARKSGGRIQDVLYAKNQFQAVTGTKDNPNPSPRFVKGPGEKDLGMILAGVGTLDSISKNLDAFTAADRRAYKEGTNVGWLDALQAKGGKTIGGTVFAENMYGGASGKITMPSGETAVAAPEKESGFKKLASAATTAADSAASLAHDQVMALDKMMGGQLLKGSTDLADMLRDITREFMSNPTFVDSSQTVNNNMPPGLASAVTGSAYNPDVTVMMSERLIVGK